MSDDDYDDDSPVFLTMTPMKYSKDKHNSSQLSTSYKLHSHKKQHSNHHLDQPISKDKILKGLLKLLELPKTASTFKKETKKKGPFNHE